MIILENVLLGGCAVYQPGSTDIRGRPMPHPCYYVWFSKGANGHLDIEWNVPKREGQEPTKSYRSSIQPIVTMKYGEYKFLIENCEIAKARNIPLDMMFKDTKVDIQLSDDGHLIGIVSNGSNIKNMRNIYHD